MSFDIDRDRLRDAAARSDLLSLLETGLLAVDPARLVRNTLTWDGDALHVLDEVVPAPVGVTAVAVGKASSGMLDAAEDVLGDALRVGLSVAPRARTGLGSRRRQLAAGHPLPDRGSVQAASEILRVADSLSQRDVFLCLLSGGGSSLIAAPWDGFDLADLRATTGLLLRSGLPIDAINQVRRHLTTAQGGRLAKAASPARTVTLILSDVIGDAFEAVASGPTVSDSSTFAGARQILVEHRLWDQLPEAVRRHIENGMAGAVPETVKPADAVFRNAVTRLIGNNATSLDAMVKASSQRGWPVHRMDTPIIGEARAAGRALGRELRCLAERGCGPVVLVAGGETTVDVRGTGRGGRNQELALAAAMEVDGVSGVSLASMGTDGIDGPTDAAGAIIDGNTIARAHARGIDVEAAFRNNDAYTALAMTSDLLICGPTGTNVADIMVGMVRDV